LTGRFVVRRDQLGEVSFKTSIGVVDGPLDSSNDISEGTRTVVPENLYGDDVGSLGYSVFTRGNGSSTVAVTTW
jgi:hypothetical protein